MRDCQLVQVNTQRIGTDTQAVEEVEVGQIVGCGTLLFQGVEVNQTERK